MYSKLLGKPQLKIRDLCTIHSEPCFECRNSKYLRWHHRSTPPYKRSWTSQRHHQGSFSSPKATPRLRRGILCWRWWTKGSLPRCGRYLRQYNLQHHIQTRRATRCSPIAKAKARPRLHIVTQQHRAKVGNQERQGSLLAFHAEVGWEEEVMAGQQRQCCCHQSRRNATDQGGYGD
jgi:hypothetical protein